MAMMHLTLPATFEVAEMMAQDTQFGKGFVFSGHAASFSKDLGNNVLQQGCFQQSITERVPDRRIKIRWMHDTPMGFVTEAHEDAQGLWIRAFVPFTATNDERMSLVKTGVVDKMSIGFDPDYSTITVSDNERKIGKLTLYEVSLVDLPLNEDTGIDTIVETMSQYVKQQEEKMQEQQKNEPKESYVGATLSAANISLLRTAAANIAKVLDSASKDASDTKDDSATKDDKPKEKDSEKKDNDVEETFADDVFSDLFNRFANIGKETIN